MERDVFDYLEKDYRYLNNYIRDLNKRLFISPHSAIIKGRTFVEKLTQEVANKEGYGLLNTMTQAERLRKLEFEGVLEGEIDNLFHTVRKLGNKAAHADVEGELEVALNIHKNIYKITCWFVEIYIDYKFEAIPYKNPMPTENKSTDINTDRLSHLMEKMESLISKTHALDKNVEQEAETSNVDKKEESEDVYEDLIIESIINTELDKKCLIQELSRLKESSKEAVEGLGEFTPFKRYMHIEREAQKELQDLIFKANESNKAQLILVCGSVGDGKSHIISYFNNNYPDVMKNFTLHNDATESLEPNKTSMDTLNEVLDSFSDEKIEKSNEKFILAINLGTLNNFIDSKYGDRFSILKNYVQDKKILETSIESSTFDENSSFQFVNFSDYHIFTLKDGKVYSKYIESLITKIVDSSEYNIFYKSYKKHCTECSNCNCCPIKANYELLSNEKVQEAIVELLVQCIIKKKIIISTRALLNFMYELIVPRSYIDVNSPIFKKDIYKLNNLNYIKSLMPNIIFNHKELSFIFDALNSLDPLNVRNQKVDDFIIEFNNSTDILPYFKQYIDYPKGYIDKVNKIDFEETEDKKIRLELLKLFIRSYYICGKGNVFSLKDYIYEDYMKSVYSWNRGDKKDLKQLYDNVKNGIVKWNGEAEKGQINVFMGKNQIKYKVSEDLELKVDTSNLPKRDETDIKKFITTLKLKYKNEKLEKAYEIDVDFSLYQLLIQVINGYRPNKKDKNQFIKFIEFINKLEETGSQNEKLIFTEKNREVNKKYKLEYDTEFEFYRFVEI
ncbi:DNA phosphorothioation-dependent restriction protein DptF [Clostridium sporogenes]|uniref:DNA phosphorothioation-dependent restriction protein DptF n=2 Tax=Clostridium sporogenes TaxID=1509 RepID=UPI000717A511|nr:DNA phosphorothioation-dependent restriction protein DptF [Clostridium sporogenes]KRU44023.1 DNA phosphorothioation-dependent restriction protein DptF [Clostridium sporogenes]MBY7064554.1 DNA phosphorothioation-dependent restriction protein DptF [Clostridium sporogenes]MBY7069825.1 DNA phosphorothioation-dependent restriction protein DptF [Clostridium sporogenes]MCW6064005.1 DNA phosphorothioation-dependent restriction protein DptF [Clostridium sporogenes]NFD92542.1 DNA phosphorothioation-d